MGNADFELQRIANAAERIADSLEKIEGHLIPEKPKSPMPLPRAAKANRQLPW